MKRTKTYDVGGERKDADQIWEGYVGSQSPGEWLRDMENTSDGGIAAAIEAYLASDPALGWLQETHEDPEAVAEALCDSLKHYRDSASGN